MKKTSKKITAMKINLQKSKYLVLIVIVFALNACTSNELNCKTETVCYGPNNTNCVEKPIPGTCY